MPDPLVGRRLEEIGTTFVHGYHLALEQPVPADLQPALDAVDLERRGWAYEGAAMALALLDGLVPWRTGYVNRFLGVAGAHVYMAHVGIGWAVARLHRRVDRVLARLDPVVGWLAVDGYGFHEGYFKWRRHLTGGDGRDTRPRGLRGYAARVFDQGLGRSLWFVRGADVDAIAETISRLEPARTGDLWSGVGLACAYAGGVDGTSLERLVEAAGPCRPQLAQGAAFAAEARHRAGNLADHTETACAIVCGCSAEAAASVARQEKPAARAPATSHQAYELWRRAIQERFARQAVTA